MAKIEYNFTIDRLFVASLCWTTNGLDINSCNQKVIVKSNYLWYRKIMDTNVYYKDVFNGKRYNELIGNDVLIPGVFITELVPISKYISMYSLEDEVENGQVSITSLKTIDSYLNDKIIKVDFSYNYNNGIDNNEEKGQIIEFSKRTLRL